MATGRSSPQKKIPVARKAEIKHKPPETQSMPAMPPLPEPDIRVEAPRRRRFVLFLLLLLLLMIGVGSFLALGGLARFGPSRQEKENEGALGRLRELQRAWWDSEALSRPGSESNRTAALGRLLEQQQQWWENEGIARDGNYDSEPLARLDEMERSWWASEGLANGEKSPEREAALKRLDELNHRWWKGEKLAKVLPDDSAAAAPQNDDTIIKLIDKENTRAFLAGGGTEESEQAVQYGLKWLAAQQQPDGHWKPQGRNDRVNRSGGLDVACTSLALLPFLAHGETHRGAEGKNTYSKVVEGGLKYLQSQQNKQTGDLRSGGNMYVHALATIALCEALDASSDPALKVPAQKAVDFLVKAQDANGGGWRYTPGSAGDLSVSSWCLMGLKSAQMAGLHVPSGTLDKATVFMKRVSRPDGGYNYLVGSPGHSPPTPAVMTAAGLVCRQYLQQSQDNPRSATMMPGVDILTKNLPEQKYRNFYYYYYGTYALLPVGGEAWKSWNPKVRDLLISWQDKGETDPALKGSWDSAGAYQMQRAGRVGCTALALLTLEVYYRHLPLNRPELGEIAKNLGAGGGGPGPKK